MPSGLIVGGSDRGVINMYDAHKLIKGRERYIYYIVLQSDRQIDRQTGIQAEKDRQTNTDRQTNRQTDNHNLINGREFWELLRAKKY